MVIKIASRVCATLFAALFLACSSNKVKTPEDWPSNARDTKLPEDYGKVGFFQHPEHIYGFDRHPDPKNGTDLVAYASTLKGEDAIVAARASDELGYDYFICNLNKELIESIDNSQSDYRYAVPTGMVNAGDSVKVALCRERKGKTQKLQELQVHPYEWKKYDFDAYILGDEKIDSASLWKLFDSTFAQAVVKRGEYSRRFKTFDKGYVLTRTEGTYGYSECAKGDIGEIMDTILQNASYYYNYNSAHCTQNCNAYYGFKKRAVAQIGYPTKRFWPLKTIGNNIQICGNPLHEAPNSGLVLEPLLKPGCKAVTQKIDVFNRNGVWRLKYENGSEIDATINDVNPECVVFAETGTSDYVGEIGDSAVAVAQSTLVGNIRVNIVLLPWTKGFEKTAMPIAIHELGHAMGLGDLFDYPLSCIPDTQSAMVGTEYKSCKKIGENNLMHWRANTDEYKLRKRGIKGGYVDELENQWECLQRIDVKESCINQNAHLAD